MQRCKEIFWRSADRPMVPLVLDFSIKVDSKRREEEGASKVVIYLILGASIVVETGD